MDADNPFQTPNAELSTPLSTDAGQRLYSLAAVGWATVFGSPLAGAYIIAQNLRILGRGTEVRKVWLTGVGVLVALLVLAFILPENIPAAAFTAAQVVGMYQYGKVTWAEQVAGHAQRGGVFYSNWRAVGIGLLILLALLVLVVPLVLLLDVA